VPLRDKISTGGYTVTCSNSQRAKRAVSANGTMEMHVDAVSEGDRVVLVDDLIATGGAAEGAVKLLRQMGAEVLAACFIIDLPDLGGAEKLRKMDVPVRTLITFGGH
jgi:adenine phosphoribosyltransferase